MIPPAPPDALSAMASTAGRFKRAFRQLANSPATWQILGLLVIVQAVPVIWNLLSGPEAPDRLYQAQILLGLKKSEVLSGSFWQPVSYALIHGNWLHLGLNGTAILLLGSKLEHIMEKRSYQLLCLYSVVAGAIMFLLLTSYGNPLPGDPQPQTLVGSSALCFAFLVFLTTVSPDSRFLPIFLSGKTLGIAIILANLILALLNPDLPTGPLASFGTHLSDQGFNDLFKVSHACHFGGALTGWLYGKYLLRPRVTLESLRRAREKSERSRQGQGKPSTQD